MTLSAGWRLRAGTHLNWAGLVAATILLQMFLQLPELLGVVATPTAQQSPLQGVSLYRDLTLEQRSADESRSRRLRAIAKQEHYMWPNATIPYIFHDNMAAVERLIVIGAMQHWSKYSCLRFVNRTNEPNYIIFMKLSYGCFSQIGREVYKIPQFLNVDNFCLANPGYIIHEIGHALGFWHEHVRPDRDDYVEVVYENVRPGLNRYFEKLPMKEIDSLDVPYDFGSIMHIKLKDYSKNGKPTLTLKVNYSDEIGQRNQLSYYDVLQVNRLYHCNMTNLKFPPNTTVDIKNITATVTSNSTLLHSSIKTAQHSSSTQPPSLSLTQTQSYSTLVTSFSSLDSTLDSIIASSISTSFPFASSSSLLGLSNMLLTSSLQLKTSSSFSFLSPFPSPSSSLSISPSPSSSLSHSPLLSHITLSFVTSATHSFTPLTSLSTLSISTSLSQFTYSQSELYSVASTSYSFSPLISLSTLSLSFTISPSASLSSTYVSTSHSVSLSASLSVSQSPLSLITHSPLSLLSLPRPTFNPSFTSNLLSLSPSPPTQTLKLPSIFSLTLPSLSPSPSPSPSLSPSSSLSPSLSVLPSPLLSSSPSLSPSLSSVLRLLSKLPSSTTVPTRTQITTSHRITLRSLRSTEPCWIACADRCSLKRCLGKNNSPLTACTSSMFMIERMAGSGTVHTGDIVLVRSFHSNQSILGCQKPTRVCKPSAVCGGVGDNITTEACEEFKVKFFVSGKTDGEVIFDSDIVRLLYVTSRPKQLDSIGCNLTGTKKCKRRSTQCLSCNPEEFEITIF